MKKISPLRARRILQGLTLHKISQETGIKTSRLSLLERGYEQIKPAEIRRLSKALKCDPYEIFLPPEVR